MTMVFDGTAGITFPNSSTQNAAGQIFSGTAVASTSGTSIDFTGIPATAKRITVLYQGVSTSSTSAYFVQIGNGTFVTTGYVSYGYNLGTATAFGSSNNVGFLAFTVPAAAQLYTGRVILINITGNTWMADTMLMDNLSIPFTGQGYITLSSALDRVRITTQTGVNTFDAGTVNILWE